MFFFSHSIEKFKICFFWIILNLLNFRYWHQFMYSSYWFDLI
ncbi:hypothetical protein WN943_025319 [Citrus x changshan-huyou]